LQVSTCEMRILQKCGVGESHQDNANGFRRPKF
jgi:hypothetical protein